MGRRTSTTNARIVSLAPSATSILCAIGARRQLVGVTIWCQDVAPVRGLPKVGDCWTGTPREVLALEPTLIVGSVPYKQETLAKLLELPVPFLAMNPRTIDDVYGDIRVLGRIAGRAAQAQRVVARMKREFEAIAKKARNMKQRPKVYCEAWPNPRISSPPWVAELVKITGGQMVLPAGERVSDEQVAATKPDVIVLAWTATGAQAKEQKAYQVAAWKAVPAVQERRVYVVRDELLNTPGPPLVEGARELFRVLHSQSRRHAMIGGRLQRPKLTKSWDRACRG